MKKERWSASGKKGACRRGRDAGGERAPSDVSGVRGQRDREGVQSAVVVGGPGAGGKKLAATGWG